MRSRFDLFMEIADIVITFALVLLMVFSYAKGCYHLMELSGFMVLWFTIICGSDRFNEDRGRDKDEEDGV